MSMARWSMRPCTPPSGIFASTCMGSPPFGTCCAEAGSDSAIAASAPRTRRLPNISSARCVPGVRALDRGTQPLTELLRLAHAPEVHEEDARLVLQHVVVDGRDLDAVL